MQRTFILFSLLLTTISAFGYYNHQVDDISGGKTKIIVAPVRATLNRHKNDDVNRIKIVPSIKTILR